MSDSKRILITGVSRGLGLAMAKGFIARGHKIAGCSRSETAPSELTGGSHHYSSVDLSSDEAVRIWSEQVLAKFGTPDLLINNAAIINRNAPLWEIEDAEFTELIDINISGVTRVIRHFTPAMIQQGSGIIVNFSSGWGRSTSPEVAPYCASKWAIEGLTQALAQELPHGVGAVAFNPGVINTDMLQSCFGGESDHYPGPTEWAERAVPFLDAIEPADNGRALTCP
ncbi:MAG: SDR family NAD(P)-dependent oxidoreductase, partial [Verrucomicrobiales bacterium]|nr:SDR family NAD(P)-dependent oxidoreductase [Verrucomicrobiales bacterium]